MLLQGAIIQRLVIYAYRVECCSSNQKEVEKKTNKTK